MPDTLKKLSTTVFNRAGTRLDFSVQGEGIALRPISENIRKAGFSVRKIARLLSVNTADVSYFIQNKKDRVGRSRRRQIKQYFIQQGWLPKPIQRPRHDCPDCGGSHIIKKPAQVNSKKSSAQLQTVSKNSHTQQ
jgi:rRNA maturation endonuclease Nob1